MEKNKKNGNSLVSFGKAGWGTIIFCMAMFWFFVGFCTDGNNITAPAVAEHLGIQSGTVLQMNSYGGILGVIFYIAFSQLTKKIGARKVAALTLIISGVAYIVMGNCPNLAVYTIAYTCLIGSIMSAGYVAGGALVAQWFPKRKGVVMGYTTMGLNIASATWVPMMTLIIAKMGFEKGVIIPGVLVAVLAVIGLVFMRDTPQERGLNPDMVSDEVFKAEYDTDSAEDDKRWTVGKLLKTPAVWTVGIATGLLQCCSTGVMSQLVVRNQELGMSATQAISMMTVIAVVGIFGSWFIGILDDKFGTKKVMILFCIWYAAAILSNVTNTTAGMYIAVIMIGISIGGSANFMTSFPSSVFGRHGFETVNSVIFPIQSILTASAFMINGISLNATGSLRWSYLILAVIALLNIIFVGLTKDHQFNLDWKTTK